MARKKDSPFLKTGRYLRESDLWQVVRLSQKTCREQNEQALKQHDSPNQTKAYLPEFFFFFLGGTIMRGESSRNTFSVFKILRIIWKDVHHLTTKINCFGEYQPNHYFGEDRRKIASCLYQDAKIVVWINKCHNKFLITEVTLLALDLNTSDTKLLGMPRSIGLSELNFGW